MHSSNRKSSPGTLHFQKNRRCAATLYCQRQPPPRARILNSFSKSLIFFVCGHPTSPLSIPHPQGFSFQKKLAPYGSRPAAAQIVVATSIGYQSTHCPPVGWLLCRRSQHTTVRALLFSGIIFFLGMIGVKEDVRGIYIDAGSQVRVNHTEFRFVTTS